MKIAVIYNRLSDNVINLFGTPNRERIGMQTIRRICDALRAGGHRVQTVEGDKELVRRLEQFMPRVLKGERPGMAFNLSYGIQGQARYTHVPAILEMVGIPYVGSGPLAHSVALDKVVTKMILRQHGLPTPDFAVLYRPDEPVPELPFPLIVKPKNEAVSFGLRVVNNADELREGARTIFEQFNQPVLVERFIEGREINVGLLGNGPPEAFPPVELDFGQGPAIYSYEDKTGRSGRTIRHVCPAPIGEAPTHEAQELAIRTFNACGCCDCARVDMRLDSEGRLWILEINSLPSLGTHSSYCVGAQAVGLDFAALVNRLVEAASARYFGTPTPPPLTGARVAVPESVFNYVTKRRDEIERRLEDWVRLSSHTADPIGLREAAQRIDRALRELGLARVDELTDERSVYTWQTPAGLDQGTLLIVHLDVPADGPTSRVIFRKEPEWIYGDGVGSSRGGLVALEYALRALRSMRLLRKARVGVLGYLDEGRDARYSERLIRAAAARARRVLVLRPGGVGDYVIIQRRGQRRYRMIVEGDPLPPGRASKQPELLHWTMQQLLRLAEMSDRRRRVSVSTLRLDAERVPMLLPHRAVASIIVTYPQDDVAQELEEAMRRQIESRKPRCRLECIADRPAMADRKANQQLFRALTKVADQWEIRLKQESSVWPSVAGLVPSGVACLCGMGPVARDLGTAREAVERISLIQRTLLLAEFLATTCTK